MSLTLSQAQWLIHFMRNLPGQAPTDPHPGAYEEAMAAQHAQAQHAQAQVQAHAAAGEPPWEKWQDEGEFDPY